MLVIGYPLSDRMGERVRQQAEEHGVYRIEGTPRSKPWEGNAKTAHVHIMKRDEQRVGEVKRYDLPRDTAPVAIDLQLDLAGGHAPRPEFR